MTTTPATTATDPSWSGFGLLDEPDHKHIGARPGTMVPCPDPAACAAEAAADVAALDGAP